MGTEGVCDEVERLEAGVLAPSPVVLVLELVDDVSTACLLMLARAYRG